MYSLAIRPELDRKLAKLIKKNRKQYERIMRKAEEIIKNPHSYKNLRKPLQHLKRVHFGSLVLVFSVDENARIVTLEDYRHHDEIYKV